MPNKDGTSTHSHLMAVKRMKEMGGQEALVPELIEYEHAEFDDELIPYWKSFIELGRRRGHGESGPLPLSWTDIDAWARLQQHKPSSLELVIITSCDEVWLDVYSKKMTQENKKSS